MVEIITEIRKLYPDCAITLSIGEKSRETYERFFNAGADRYLLRHETADKDHYEMLHPAYMSYEHRINCIKNLKEIGFQTGMGFMVGSPCQTIKNLTQDLLLLKEIEPQMVGIGPFIPHCDTPFKEEKQGDLNTVLLLISIIRLLLPKALIPSTTALGTIDHRGRELGILSGANVVMPNLSPVSVRKKYTLYDNKICTGEEAAECRFCLENRIKSIGYEIAVSRGDYSETPVENV
jgi:biotin synthase